MRALCGPGRNLTWFLAVAIISLGVSVVTGRYHGHVTDFVSGFFLGLSLAVAVLYLIVAPRRGNVGEQP